MVFHAIFRQAVRIILAKVPLPPYHLRLPLISLDGRGSRLVRDRRWMVLHTTQKLAGSTTGAGIKPPLLLGILLDELQLIILAEVKGFRALLV